MTLQIVLLLILAGAVGFVVCFLFWQAADVKAAMLREQRVEVVRKIAVQTILDTLIAGGDEHELASYYGVAVEEIAELRRAGGLDSSHTWIRGSCDNCANKNTQTNRGSHRE